MTTSGKGVRRKVLLRICTHFVGQSNSLSLISPYLPAALWQNFSNLSSFCCYGFRFSFFIFFIQPPFLHKIHFYFTWRFYSSVLISARPRPVYRTQPNVFVLAVRPVIVFIASYKRLFPFMSNYLLSFSTSYFNWTESCFHIKYKGTIKTSLSFWYSFDIDRVL